MTAPGEATVAAGPPVVRAAGGVVWRPAGADVPGGVGSVGSVGGEAGGGGPADGVGARSPGAVEVLLVHRPHRRDWSFPKGKADPGEDDESCARREVAEETGLRCRLGADLGFISYIDAKGRPKSVHWWAMTTEAGAAAGDGPDDADEVDEVRWLRIDDAAAQLSYDNDRLVLARFRRAVLPSATAG